MSPVPSYFENKKFYAIKRILLLFLIKCVSNFKAAKLFCKCKIKLKANDVSVICKNLNCISRMIKIKTLLKYLRYKKIRERE